MSEDMLVYGQPENVAPALTAMSYASLGNSTWLTT